MSSKDDSLVLSLACLCVSDVMIPISVCGVQIIVFGLVATLLTGFLLRVLDSRRKCFGKRESNENWRKNDTSQTRTRVPCVITGAQCTEGRAMFFNLCRTNFRVFTDLLTDLNTAFSFLSVSISESFCECLFMSLYRKVF